MSPSANLKKKKNSNAGAACPELYNFPILSIVEFCFLKYNELSIHSSLKIQQHELVDKDASLLAMVSFTAHIRCYFAKTKNHK